jgi:hypothetical protein
LIVEQMMKPQAEYVRSRHKYRGLIAGRRYGKSHAIQVRIISDALSRPGHRGMYLTPDGSLCHEIFRDIINSPVARKRIARVEKQPVRQIFWRNGSRDYFRMFDRPDKALGFGFDDVAFDEIQKLDSLPGRDDFMRVIRPLIMDRKGGLTIAGQWRGKGCWWHKWFLENETNPKYRLWNLPTWEGYQFREGREDHPEIVDAKETLPKAIYDQEIACIPAANAAAVFFYEDLEAAITKDKNLDKGEAGKRYVIGADLGRTRDPSAWVVMECGTHRVVYSSLRKIGEKHQIGAEQLSLLSQRFGNAFTIIDATGGATGGKQKDVDVFLRYYREKIKVLGKKILTKKSKETLIQQLSLAFQNGSIRIPEENEELVDQLRTYEYKECSMGGYFYQGPGGHGDDMVIALALAYDAALRYGSGGQTIEQLQESLGSY